MAEVDRKPTWQSGGNPKKRPRGRPKGYRASVQPLEQIIAIKRRLDLPDAILTFRGIAAELSKRRGKSVGIGTVCRFADGIEPSGKELREVFGLPVTVPVAVCRLHGVVHEKRCPGANPKPRRPSLRARRKALWRDERWRSSCTGMRINRPHVSPRPGTDVS